MIRILTYNVKLLPSYAKLAVRPWLCRTGWWESGQGWSDADRAERIRAALIASDADIIVLQELFQESERESLQRELADAGYVFTTAALGDDWLNEDSGLFAASRLPVRSHSFEEFDAKSGEDALSDKGIVALDVDVSSRWPGLTSLRVFGAHMQSGHAAHAVRDK